MREYGLSTIRRSSEPREKLATIVKAIEKTNREVMFGPQRFRSGQYRLPYGGLSLRLMLSRKKQAGHRHSSVSS
jgi:hypothetical protein